jgi:hypothetical protein
MITQTKLPYLQVRHNSLVFYELSDYRPARKSLNFKPSYSGKMTSGSVKRIRKAVDILIQRSPPKMVYNPIIKKSHSFTLGFVTLTISDNTKISAKDAHKKLLRPWLRRMKSICDFEYIWKVEFQKRGQLHYHVTINEFIDYRIIKKEWNRLQRKAGLLEKFATKFKHYNPNSTDVHAVYKVKDIAAYLSKYLSKANTKKVNGKVWDCSMNLKRKRFSFVLENANDTLIRKDIELNILDPMEFDRCVIFDTKNPQKYLTPKQYQDYQKWLA